jgi:uncharacterized repeat protein (TIGR01451 family)
MKKALTLLVFCFLLATLHAQNSYTIASIPYNPDPFNGNTPAGIVWDDGWGPTVTLPFNFCYYNATYNKLVIGSNGLITFDTTRANGYCPWTISAPFPDLTLGADVIASPWQDLNPMLGGDINYAIRGVTPYRRFVVSYDSVPMFSCTTSYFSQQVILYETTNIIEFQILNKAVCTTWNAGAAIQGVQVDSTTAFVVPGRNFPTQWAATNDAYRFSPVGVCAGPMPPDSIRGKVYADLNSNCVQDVNESPIMNRAILANGGQFYAWTDINGEYEMSLAPGTFAVNEYMTGYFLPNACLPAGTHNVTLSGNAVNGVDFADSAITACTDLTVGLGSSFMRRCDSARINVSYCNNGSLADANTVVEVVLHDSLTPFASTIPYTITGLNTYSFAVGLLNPGQCGSLAIDCILGCDSAGTIYALTGTISGSQPVDCNLFNNTDIAYETVGAPFDPNSKRVAAQSFSTRGYVDSDIIDDNDTLTYRIDFQNVGTAYAEDVVIRDTLDIAHLDINSFQALGASANYNYIIIGNEVLFRFENINLPDSNTNEPNSHGFVKYRIRQNPGNQPCTVIRNNASIYFDQEAPIVTNSTTNTIPAPTIDLGQDTLLCSGQSLSLGLTSNWTNYAWSTGATTSGITVASPGTYSLTVTDANGCSSTDLIVVQQSVTPGVFLGNDTTTTLPIVVDAGSGFASYLWSTGATTQIITVGQTGTYWVQVTNQDGCVGTDTINVILQLVGVNLPQGYALSVSPVPANDRLQVRMELPTAQCVVMTLTDLAGRSLWTSATDCSKQVEMEVNLSRFANGTYLLDIQGEGIQVSRRVVVMQR